MSEKDFLAHLKENQRIIFKLVNIYARDADDRKDLQQEIILQAWKGYPRFKGESKFSTWLYRLSLNTILTMRRRTSELEYRENLESLNATSSPFETKDNTELLYNAIKQLNDAEKAIISLSLEGYDNKEIADIIGISSNLVGVKVFRAKQRLTEILKKA